VLRTRISALARHYAKGVARAFPARIARWCATWGTVYINRYFGCAITERPWLEIGPNVADILGDS